MMYILPTADTDRRMLTSLSVDVILLPMCVNMSANISSANSSGMATFRLKYFLFSFICVHEETYVYFFFL